MSGHVLSLVLDLFSIIFWGIVTATRRCSVGLRSADVKRTARLCIPDRFLGFGRWMLDGGVLGHFKEAFLPCLQLFLYSINIYSACSLFESSDGFCVEKIGTTLGLLSNGVLMTLEVRMNVYLLAYPLPIFFV